MLLWYFFLSFFEAIKYLVELYDIKYLDVINCSKLTDKRESYIVVMATTSTSIG